MSRRPVPAGRRQPRLPFLRHLRGALQRLLPRRLEVRGASMAPTLLPGDRLLTVPVARLRRGDLVVVADPTSPARLVVKRVGAPPGRVVRVGPAVLAAGDGVVVLGDNPAASTDSRAYGPAPRAAVRGRVWYRYAPPERVGRLPRRAERGRAGTRRAAPTRSGGRRWARCRRPGRR